MRIRIWGPALGGLLAACALLASPAGVFAKAVGSAPVSAPGGTTLSADQAQVKARLVSLGIKPEAATTRAQALKPAEARFLAEHPAQVKVGAIPYGALILSLIITLTLWLWNTFG